MTERYREAIKEVTDTYRKDIENIKQHKLMYDAFENAEAFDIAWITSHSIKIKPKNKDITARELSIELDEILFDLPFEPKSENLDSSDMNIFFGNYPKHFAIHIQIKENTKCKVIELSSKARIHTYYDKTYAIVCEA